MFGGRIFPSESMYHYSIKYFHNCCKFWEIVSWETVSTTRQAASIRYCTVPSTPSGFVLERSYSTWVWIITCLICYLSMFCCWNKPFQRLLSSLGSFVLQSSITWCNFTIFIVCKWIGLDWNTKWWQWSDYKDSGQMSWLRLRFN